MKFYNELSKVYDVVFPKSEDTLKFLLSGLKTNSKVLDLACGTGTYSVALAQKGHRVEGLDLDEDMIKLARSKGGLYANFVVGDMTKFKESFPKEKYDLIFCIGNSLVHLKNKERIDKFIKDIYEGLNPNGTIVIQIVNYDRILRNDVKSLPTIDKSDKGVKFVRNYEYNKDEEKIDFITELSVTKGEIIEKFENTVSLVPLQKDELVSMFEKAGFKNIDIYGGFCKEEFEDTSFALVIRAEKR
jgi:ubiquinone/menaquinone biosynthesis C-methylase UbiE